MPPLRVCRPDDSHGTSLARQVSQTIVVTWCRDNKDKIRQTQSKCCSLTSRLCASKIIDNKQGQIQHSKLEMEICSESPPLEASMRLADHTGRSAIGVESIQTNLLALANHISSKMEVSFLRASSSRRPNWSDLGLTHWATCRCGKSNSKPTDAEKEICCSLQAD